MPMAIAGTRTFVQTLIFDRTMTRNLNPPRRTDPHSTEDRDIAGLCRRYRCTEAELRSALAATRRPAPSIRSLDDYFQNKRTREVNHG
jgi:hypothetical protein